MTTPDANKRQMQIYRAARAPGLVESGCMQVEAMSEMQRGGLNKLIEAGYLQGEEISVLVDMPGFSLTHAWLKKDYPLMRHSHDSDCMYYIVAGSLRLGTEELGPKDCFFVPADVPYTYVPGPDGVEVLEIRHEPKFNFVNLSSNAAWWQKAEETCKANGDAWKTVEPPSKS